MAVESKPVPDETFEQRRVTSLIDPDSPSAESFRSLRFALKLRLESQPRKAILFTSADPGDGKSTVAANYSLAASLSQRALLIDADMHRPHVHEIFGLARSPGLVDLFVERLLPDSLERVVASYDALDIITAGRPVLGASDHAASKRMEDIIERALEAYDTVVLDSSPVMGAADAIGLASQRSVDVLLVVRPTTRRRRIRQALRELALVDANVVGVVANGDSRATAMYTY
jgi:capsular exopolysaccharide synthesis family protein